MSDTLRVTEHSRFLVCNAPGGETRYYADTPHNKAAARDLDEAGDPVAINGFGVYDTSISTVYAVAVYGSKEEANAHPPSKTPPPSESLFEQQEAEEVDTDLPDPGYAEGHPAESYRPKAVNPIKPKRNKR